MNGEQVTRGDLPHWYCPGFAHFVTYRLADSIPISRLFAWQNERAQRVDELLKLGQLPTNAHAEAHQIFFQRYDAFLDQHGNARWLESPLIAEIIRKKLRFHNGSLYELLAWCVMPNHVHVLLQPFEYRTEAAGPGCLTSNRNQPAADSNGLSDEIVDHMSPLSRIMHSLKSYTASQANRILGRTGRSWQRESYDHWVRDIDEFNRITNYIRMNPVKAGLCETPEMWRFSSAYDRWQLDGSRCGLVGRLRDDWLRS